MESAAFEFATYMTEQLMKLTKPESKDAIVAHQLTLAFISCCRAASICWCSCKSYSLPVRKAYNTSVGLT